MEIVARAEMAVDTIVIFATRAGAALAHAGLQTAGDAL